jgi:hypothetical protein
VEVREHDRISLGMVRVDVPLLHVLDVSLIVTLAIFSLILGFLPI